MCSLHPSVKELTSGEYYWFPLATNEKLERGGLRFFVRDSVDTAVSIRYTASMINVKNPLYDIKETHEYVAKLAWRSKDAAAAHVGSGYTMICVSFGDLRKSTEYRSNNATRHKIEQNHLWMEWHREIQ